jgi:hypothetical protein
LIRVILESPFGSSDPKVVEENITYARRCIRDCLMRGETPFASHLLYTQEGVLDDNNPEERKFGIEAGFEWRESAEKTVVYTDRGISKGMECGIAHAKKILGHEIIYRTLCSSEINT